MVPVDHKPAGGGVQHWLHNLGGASHIPPPSCGACHRKTVHWRRCHNAVVEPVWGEQSVLNPLLPVNVARKLCYVIR